MARGDQEASCGLGRLGLAGGSLIFFAVSGFVGLAVRDGTRPLRVDIGAARIVDSARLGTLLTATHGNSLWNHALLQVVTAYGLPAAASAVAVGLALVAWRRGDRGAFVLCLLGPPVAVLLADLVAKPVVGRHRHGGLSYPSGHTTGAAAVAGLALLTDAVGGTAMGAATMLALAASIGFRQGAESLPTDAEELHPVDPV